MRNHGYARGSISIWYQPALAPKRLMMFIQSPSPPPPSPAARGEGRRGEWGKRKVGTGVFRLWAIVCGLRDKPQAN